MRYPRELRSDPQQIAREVLIPTMDGAMIPLGQLAKVVVAKGAPSIRTENALLSAYIYVDIRDRDISRMGSRVEQSFLVIAGLGVIVLCAARADAFWIANTMFAGFAVSAVVGSVARVVAYRRGLV